MYSLDWLRGRVLFHLDPIQSTGEVFVAEIDSHEIAGHFIVRIETDETYREFGLGSTIYVAPSFRRQGIAQSLLTVGENWMRERGVANAVYYTADTNEKLISLFCKQGYELVERAEEMVKLRKSLSP